MTIKVKKASGEFEPFSEEKVESSLRRAGADNDLIKKILLDLKKNLYNGISTHQIYSQVFKILKKKRSDLTFRYNLKKAILELGPSGYPFENFCAGVLEHYGYKTTIDQIINGKCISHEIDIIAQKNKINSMIECKFHLSSGKKSGIKTALYVYARFLDVKDYFSNTSGHLSKFHEVWLVTNTRVTSEVVTYAKCVGLKVVSWDYPVDFSLRFLIEKSNLHPITCLEFLTRREKKDLLAKGVVFSKNYQSIP